MRARARSPCLSRHPVAKCKLSAVGEPLSVRVARQTHAGLSVQRQTRKTRCLAKEIKMPTVKSADASVFQIRSDARRSSKGYNQAWGHAEKSGFFLKKQKMVGIGKDRRPATVTDRDGKQKITPRRTNRCLRRHAIKILLSASISDAAKNLELENGELAFEPSGENARAPALFTISKGATLLFEHALAAYTQSIFSTAVNIVDNAGVHMKPTAGAVKAAVEIVNTKIQRATSTAPFVFNANPYYKAAEKKKTRSSRKARGEEGADGADGGDGMEAASGDA